MAIMSPGAKFRAAMKAEKPLQCVGAINAYHARLAERTGYQSVYLSGGGVAAGSLGLPDLGISNLEDVLIEARRITDACFLPLLELRSAGVSIALYPLSAFRAMNAAALKVYNAIRKEGTQKSVIDLMQTRADLYETLDYLAYERKLDQLFAKEKTR